MSCSAAPSSPPPARHRTASRLTSVAGLTTLAIGMTVSGLSATARAATPPTWRTESTPALTGAGFQGISCPTATTCVGVGSTSAGVHSTAVAETDKSGVWSIDEIPQPPRATDTAFTSVSCTSPTACVAVGYVDGTERMKPFSEVLRGTTWTILPTAPLSGVTGAELESVSCTEAGDCRAVGSWYPVDGNSGTLVEDYNGSMWKLVKTRALDGAASFSGVSCLPDTVPALCTAVGSLTHDSRSAPLVEQGDGNDWTVVAVPNLASSQETALSSISCPQSTSCVAVGSALDGSTLRSISEIDDEHRWTLVTAPHVHSSDTLAGVSCPLTIDSCRAVGFSGTAGTLSLAETWNGRDWAVQTSATPSSNLAELLGVSCVTVGLDGVTCTAAGEYQDDPMGPSNTLAEAN